MRRTLYRIAIAAVGSLIAVGPAAADVLDRIRETASIRVGVRADAPPFSYFERAGQPQGLAVALCRRVVDYLATAMDLPTIDIEYVPVNARSRFDALTRGQTDLHCGPASATLKRRVELDFSVLYFVDGAAAVVRPATYQTVFDIADGKIGVSAGTTTEQMVRNLVNRNGLDATIVTFPSHQLGLETLARAKIDAYFGDSAIMRFQIDNRELDSKLELLPETFSFEPYALVMKRGESALRLAVDRALSQVYDSGEIYNLIKDEMGDYRLSPLNRAVYQIVGLPG
ncbi:MAG: amino acid ABC transporter substrate-binding protein [Pseudomonadota bacterium]